MAKKKRRYRGERQTTTNISMPSTLRRSVESRIEAGGFGNVSEYFRHLVRQDLDELDYRRRRLEAMIDEGERSGPPIVADRKFWNDRLSTLRRRLGIKRRKAG